MIERIINVKSYDVFPNSTMKPSALQHYMQQFAREDCDEMGITYNDMRKVNMVFVMTKLAISVNKPVFAYDVLTVKTFNNSIKGVTWEREFEFFRNGEKVIHATTQWVVVQFDDRKIIRPRDFPFEIEALGIDCGSLDIPRGIKASEVMENRSERRVRLSDLDENDHLNNCVYSDITMDYIDEYNRETDYVKDVVVIFRHEAKIDDVLSVSVGEIDGKFVVNALNTTNESPCFEAEIGLGKI